MKNIAVITGASSGIGKKFTETLAEHGTFDEVWVIARREGRLEELKSKLPFPVRPIALDLSDVESHKKYAALLEEEKPRISLLINCSGFGKFCATLDTPLEENLNMVDLNCKAVMAMCQNSIPYMPEGAKIINIASVGGLSADPVYQRVRRDQGVRSKLQPCAEPRASLARNFRHRGMSVLDKNGIFQSRC